MNTFRPIFSKLRQAGLVLITAVVLVGAGASACSSVVKRRDVIPLVMRDVPAQRLAFRLEPDTSLPSEIKSENPPDKVAEIQTDFNTNRKDDALLRTIKSPDGQRALALYGTADDPTEAFRVDLYAADGKFLRNLMPPELVGAFPESAAWSPDGNYITFIARRSTQPSPSPTPPDDAPVVPDSSPLPTAAPSVAPVFAPVVAFNTEQIYICNRDGYELKPLTSREGLIYFSFAWAPDNHALAALACKEEEWNAREKESKLPAGRPRLISPEGTERLLDDQVTEAQPVWSPDSSKVATAFDTDVGIYDAATEKFTQARLPLREPLLAASRVLEQKNTEMSQKSQSVNQSTISNDDPASFNPIVRLEWPAPEKLYIKTAYVRLMSHDTINTFQRWHLIVLSPQAAILK